MAQAYNKFNEVMVPIALAVDAAKVAAAASKDYDNKTTRNTVEAAVQVTSGWTGGYLGEHFSHFEKQDELSNFILRRNHRSFCRHSSSARTWNIPLWLRRCCCWWNWTIITS